MEEKGTKLLKTTIHVKRGADCPYLDTIDRRVLDFDFEKCCSISLTTTNVYACLVCGKYFQGRGHKTYAYTHSLEINHHIFMRIEDGTVWCLPEGYKVEDQSLNDIVSLLNPTFTAKDIDFFDKSSLWSHAIDGKDFMPGLVGINKMKGNSYANVVIQIIARVRPVRDFLLSAKDCSGNSLLLKRTSELLKKIWHPRQFKGQVSPHQFLRAVISESKHKFLIAKEGDPVLFLTWLLNSLQNAITDDTPASHTAITGAFLGEIEIQQNKENIYRDGETQHIHYEKSVLKPFLILNLDLPPAPLFRDSYDRMQIPQVSLFKLLQKYDSKTVHSDVNEGLRRYRITRLPNFLLLSIQRFSKNNFFWEKNPSIVNFPIKNLDLKDVIPVPDSESSTKYDLVASVSHEGKAESGSYKVYINRCAEDLWYEIRDLTVVEVLPQMVCLSEAYLQVYERCK